MSDFGMIMAPSAPNWLQIRSLESSYQVAMIADNPADLRRFIVSTQAMQTQALLNTNTQLAQVNSGIFGIQRGIGELNSSVQEGFSNLSNTMQQGFGNLSNTMQQGFGNLSNTMQQGFGELSDQLTDMSYAISAGFTQMAEELHRQNETMNEIARLLSTRLEGEAKEIRNSALSAVREGCAPEAFDQEGSLREALKLMKITVEHPMGMRDYVAWFNIGWLLWKLDSNLEDAEKAFATAVRQSMDKKDAYHVMAARHLAYMRYLQKKTDSAYQGIRLALQTSSEDADNLYTLLLIAAQAGNESEVASAFRKLIQDHPEQLAICLTEKELEPYSKGLQQVVDELVNNARVKINDTINHVNAKLHAAEELAASIGRDSILNKSTFDELDQIRKTLKKTPVNSLDWSSLHGMIYFMNKLEDDINSDMEPIKTLTLIHVPAGEFLYGEKRERIRLNSFSIMKFPVTVRQYRLFCDATHRRMPDAPDWGWIDDHPMVNVTWHDAAAFAQWVGGSLPTEKQWEKAARGTDGREYPWGNTFDVAKCVCSVGNRRSSTAPVGSCPAGASPYGCMDMAGNVYEWCADWWDSSNQHRVLRGGFWNFSNTVGFRAAYRLSCDPGSASNDGGFRVVFQGSV